MKKTKKYKIKKREKEAEGFEEEIERKDIIKRIKTGVPGLDELLFGGIPTKSLVVINGEPGSGKTILCLEYLYNGIMKYNEPGVFISLEESEDELLTTARNFGWDFEKLIKEKKFMISSQQLYDFEQLCSSIETLVEKIGAVRIVIDPGVIFRLYFDKELEARKKILELSRILKRIGCTSIITNELVTGQGASLFGLEEYVADGVILLYHTKLEDRFVRGAAVLKMRNTRISETIHPIRINSKGIQILAEEELLEGVK